MSERRKQPRRKGFTLVEVLAALTLIAIVLPAALRGISSATNAASLARRRNEAAALAQSKMDELLATQAWSSGGLSGDFVSDGWPDYSWSAELVQWNPNGMMMSNGLSNDATAGTSTTGTGSASSSTASINTGMTSTASASNNTIQELDLHITWTDRRGQQTLTLSTLVYQSGNSLSSTSDTTQ